MATVKESQYQTYLVFILHMRHVEVFDHNGKNMKKKMEEQKVYHVLKEFHFFFRLLW